MNRRRRDLLLYSGGSTVPANAFLFIDSTPFLFLDGTYFLFLS